MSKLSLDESIALPQAVHSTETAMHVTFTLFSELPVELRLKVWEIALQEPRVFEVYYSDQYDNWCFDLKSKPNAISLRTVSTEAREQFLKSSTWFSFDYRPQRGSRSCTFFNRDVNTIYLRATRQINLGQMGGLFVLLGKTWSLQGIQHLAIRGEAIMPYDDDLPSVESLVARTNNFLENFPVLKSVDVVFGDDWRQGQLGDSTIKPVGPFKLKEWVCQSPSLDNEVGLKANLQSWMDCLVSVLTQPSAVHWALKRSERGGKQKFFNLFRKNLNGYWAVAVDDRWYTIVFSSKDDGS